VVGLYALQRRPANRTGKLMLLTGVAFWLPLGEATRVSLLWTLGATFEAAWAPVLTYLLLSFPNGRLIRRLDWAMVMAMSLPLFAWQVVGSFFYDPRAYGCTNCQRHLNLLLIHSFPPYVNASSKVAYATVGLTLVAITCLITVRWWRASRPARRVLGPVLLPAAGFYLAVAAQQAIQLSIRSGSPYLPSPWVLMLITDVAVASAISLPLGFLLGLLIAWTRRGRISTLVMELGELPPLDKLEQALSRALGDPSLSVGRWDPSVHRYVTSDGEVLDIPEDSPRVAMFLEREGMPLAALVHDPALLEDRGLLDSVSAAARLAVDNERMRAEIQAQLEEVRASRSRIVAAADEERHRLERDLHDGAQQRLASLTLSLRAVESELGPEADPSLRALVAETAQGLAGALQELRELARGIHPSVLTEEGLCPALESLAERSAVPVRLLDAPQGRFPAAVEAAAYFVVSEALANTAKHARASEARVAVKQTDSRLVVEVADDGVGGADPDGGSGLRGLADRVAAVGGRFEVKSSPGDGTTVVAEIPCGSS
jgi:signal transduction histidine kinase